MRLGTRVATLVMAAIGCATAPTTPLIIVALDREPSADCQSLGEVSGEHYAYSPSADEARTRAWRAAQDLGATHVLTVSSTASGPHTRSFTGKAFRCAPGAVPGPAK